jgi:hypothetical protein
MIAACAANPEPPPRDPEAEKELGLLLERRDQLQKDFEASSIALRRRCELSDGECLMQLVDRRVGLLHEHSTSQCKAEPDSEKEVRCTAKHLASVGNAGAAGDYYGFEAWCFEQLTQCTARLEQEAAEAARLERVARRRRVLEASSQGIELRAGIEFAKERNDYLRATLPPQADELCKDGAVVEQCGEAARGQARALDDELGKEDAAYDAEAGARLYAELLGAEAGCYEPEFACLSSNVERFGVTRYNQRVLAQSLEVLEQRQLLLLRVDAEAGKECLESGVAKHQARIVQGYQLFVREPVVYFWGQLHKAFLSLHKAQVRCLEASESLPQASAGSTPASPLAKR